MKLPAQDLISYFCKSCTVKIHRYKIIVTRRDEGLLIAILILTDIHGRIIDRDPYFVGVYDGDEWVRMYYYSTMIEATDMYNFQITDLL